MNTGYEMKCPSCGRTIDDFSLADEWFCECGDSGIFEGDEEDGGNG